MRFLIIFITLCFSSIALANLPYFPLKFPRDEGSHHDNIPYNYNDLLERWSLNGKLLSVDGDILGYHFSVYNTLYNDNGKIYSLPAVLMQVTDVKNKKSYSAFSSYPMNKVNFDYKDLHIQFDDSNYFEKESALYTAYHLRVEGLSGEDQIQFGLHFEIDAIKLANQTGLIQMPGNVNSYAYFMPHLETSGFVKINNQIYRLPISGGGDSWLEHSWGDYNNSNYGWESLNVRLENGISANMFINVELDTKKIIDGFIDVVFPNGDVRTIPSTRFTVKRRDNLHGALGHTYPQTFDIDIPELSLHVISTSAYPKPEEYGFWKGYHNVTASYNNQPYNGYSYAELIYYS